MTKPKTDSEFDYSSINVMAIGVMAMIVIMIFFFFFFVAALVISQPKAGDSVSPKQEILHHDDTDELLMWEFFLNESVNHDW